MDNEIIRNSKKDAKLHKALREALIKDDFEEMTSEKLDQIKLDRMLKKIKKKQPK